MGRVNGDRERQSGNRVKVFLRASAAIVALLLAAPLWPDAPPAPIRVLILSGRNNHEWRQTTPALRVMLERSGRFEVRVTEEPAGLTGATLEPYDALLVDYNGPRWGEAAESAFEAAVRSGKGAVFVHAASYAFGELEVLGEHQRRTGRFEPAWPAYARIVGGHWSAAAPRTGHGKRHSFSVRWTDRRHPIAAGLPQSFTTNDELYHNIRLLPGARVLATAFDDPKQNGTGKDEPLLWTVQYGEGRVFHTALGHDIAAMMAPGFVSSLVRGVEWAATGAVAAVTPPQKPAPVRVMVVTGGHGHEPSFYSLFEGRDDIAATVNPHPIAFRGDLRKRYDVIVFYDMLQQLDEAQQKNLRDFAEAGKGLVVLHHALANYNAWAWWTQELVGGSYRLKESKFQHDVEMDVQPVADHPLLRGVGPMRIEDETYKEMWISPGVKVLLKTDHPASDGPVAWISPYANSRVVAIQLGHGRTAHVHPGYRRLVQNAILWSAGRMK